MTRHAPPVPPAGRSPKGPGGDRYEPATDSAAGMPEGKKNLSEQDRQGNIHQNTTHQGYQQDR